MILVLSYLSLNASYFLSPQELSCKYCCLFRHYDSTTQLGHLSGPGDGVALPIEKYLVCYIPHLWPYPTWMLQSGMNQALSAFVSNVGRMRHLRPHYLRFGDEANVYVCLGITLMTYIPIHRTVTFILLDPLWASYSFLRTWSKIFAGCSDVIGKNALLGWEKSLQQWCREVLYG